MHLGQRQALLQPGLDLRVLTGDGFPRRTLAIGPTRPDLGDHRRQQLIGQLAGITVAVYPARTGPVDVPAHRLTVGARQPGHLPQPPPLQP